MRTLELIMAVAIMPYLSFLCLLPESPRWLLSKGRTEDARVIFKRGLKVNKKPLALLDHLDRNIQPKPKKPAFVTDLLRFPGIRRNLLCMSFCWFCVSMGYYGLIYNTPSFGWNLYITFVMPAFFSLPLMVLQPFLENNVGRRRLFTFLMALSAVALVCTLAVPKDKFAHNWPIMVLAWTGTISLNFCFGLGYVYSKELFPTSHRTIALSVSSACARLGGIASPFVAMLKEFDSIYALALYGFFLLVGTVVSLFIWPDTKNTDIPNTLEECEQMAKRDRGWFSCRKK